MDSRAYQVGQSRITLIFGDLTTSKCEVLVSSDNCYLSMGGGVSRAIKQAAGPRYHQEAEKFSPPRREHQRFPSPGDVVVTPAVGLGAKYVLHAISLAPNSAPLPPDAVVRQACQRVMELLPLLGCRSVAFPCIGTGYARIDPIVAAEQMAGVLVRSLLESDDAYEVELYLMDRQLNLGTAEAFYPTFERYLHETLAVAVLERDGGRQLMPPEEPESTTGANTEASRRFDIYTMLQRLDRRRDEVDAAIHAALDRPEIDLNAELSRLEEQLEAVSRLRRIYEGELVLSARPSQVERGTVFLSSTWEDLKEHRSLARSAIERQGLGFIGMEEFPPTGTAPVDFIRHEVNRAEVYVGVLGMRYGSVDPALGFSMTELEYRQAVASRKPRHLFVIGDGAQVPISCFERDPDRYRKLLEFRERVLKENTVLFFNDPEDLVRKIVKTLAQAFKLGAGDQE